MTALWAWEASAPEMAAAGVCGDFGQAQRAASRWMMAHRADAGLLEEVRLAIGAGSLLTRHERTGLTLRDRDGRVRWRLSLAARAD